MKKLNKKLCLLLLICALITPNSFVNAEEGENNGGNNPITSEETPSQDPGNENNTPTTNTEEKEETKQSDDATLKTLTVNGENIDLKSDKREYEIVVKSDVDTADIDAKENDSKAKIDKSNSNLGKNDLKVGTTTFKITVIPESGEKNKKEYQIKITRATDNLNLTKLNIQGQKLNEPFDPDTTEYTADVTYNVTSVTIQQGHPTGTDVSVKGNTNLKVGKNTVTVTVKNKAGESKEYTIIVTRGTEEELNSVDYVTSEVLSEVTSTETSVEVIAKDDDTSDSFPLRSIIIITSSVLLLLIASLGIYFYVKTGDSEKRKQKRIAKLKKKQAKIEEQLTGLMPVITEEQEQDYLNKRDKVDNDEEQVKIIEEDIDDYEDDEQSDFEDTIEINSASVNKKSFEYDEFNNYDDDEEDDNDEVVTRRRRVDRSILDDEIADLFEDGDE